MSSSPMDGDASLSANSLKTARRLLARQAPPQKTKDPQLVGAALQRTLEDVSQNLRDSMGEEGCAALFARATAVAEARHPALHSVRPRGDGAFYLDGLVASVEAHGVTTVTAAIQALLAALVDVLGRLIGEDMAIRLIDQDAQRSRADPGQPS